MEHGSGGALSRELIEEVIYPYFSSDAYNRLDDATSFTISGEAAFTTDTYVVDPLFFPGGDIGRLAVFGTCNDLAVSGAMPKVLSMGLVLEEGLPLDDLKSILESVRMASQEAGVNVVTGDTKVVPRGKGGGVYINTAGIGTKAFQGILGPNRVQAGDAVVVSAAPGAHGIAILAARENLKTGSILETDCAYLFPLCESLFGLGEDLRFMRDATRGGISAVLNETAEAANLGMLIRGSDIPSEPAVASVARILGLDVLDVANEGLFIAVVAGGSAQRAVEALRAFPHGARAATIGEVRAEHPGRVVLETPIGGRRILDFPRGLLLPRIC
jgi:hydrogenase expression/formation protein HypE